MKFDCGETWLEKKNRLENWHSFFAILPRQVADHDCRWLEYIERKETFFPNECSGQCWVWEYKATKK